MKAEEVTVSLEGETCNLELSAVQIPVSACGRSSFGFTPEEVGSAALHHGLEVTADRSCVGGNHGGGNHCGGCPGCALNECAAGSVVDTGIL